MNETTCGEVSMEVSTDGGKQKFLIHADGHSEKNLGAMKNEDINSEDFPSHFEALEETNNIDQNLVPICNVKATTSSPELIIGDKQVIIWDELCRVCATSNEKLVSVFGTEGTQFELETKIQEYLPQIRLSQDDFLPMKVCYNCISILVGWHDIYTKCDQAQERLLELHRQLHPKDQLLHLSTSEEISLSNEENHSIDMKDEIQHYDPNLVAVSSDNNVDIPENKRANGVDGNDHPAVSPNHYSEDCSSPAGTGSSTGDVATTLYQCGVCELLFEQEIELLRHLKGAHKSPANLEYQCTLCLRKFLSKVRLVRHLANHRRNNDLVNPESIAAERQRISENSGHHYKCELCQKILSSRLNMIRHLRMHKDERLSVCHVCGKSFRSDGDVKRHINDVHLKLKRHSCEYCGRAFAAKATKDAHQRIHTGEKPFLCSQCPRRFRSINLLGVHKKVHENHRPFGCAYCPKTFRSKQKVQVHESVHTGYKPFECDVCGSAFSSKGECKRHSISHSSERPFECSLCDKSFKLNKYLRGHLRKCHPKEAPDILYQMDN
uniref:Protein krueppel n=1 Tax=Trichogramma kaykai TaxID=54128 RepID=A0ABD2XH79_9HYME